ncbi:MAG: DUF4332 domain-containing protein [Gammaproteobacteria bacterium]
MMSYLIQQMWLCLLLASLIGAFIGWWFAKSTYRSKLDDLDAKWQRRLDEKESDYSRGLEINDKLSADVAAPIVSIAEKSSYDVEEIEGIGKNYGKKLRDMGISTTEQLLNQCCNLDGRITVAEQIGIEDFVVHKWASMADLMRVNGIAGQFSELMVYAGIDSTQDLGQENAAALYSKLSVSNHEHNCVKTLPDDASLDRMINQAKSLNIIMQDT